MKVDLYCFSKNVKLLNVFDTYLFEVSNWKIVLLRYVLREKCFNKNYSNELYLLIKMSITKIISTNNVKLSYAL